MKFEKLKQKFEEFFKLHFKNALIVCDDDNDGIASAVLMKKFLESKKIKSKVVASSINEAELKAKIGQLKYYDCLITLDLPIDQKEKIIKQIKQISKPVLVIDHHLFEKNISNDVITYLNPRMIEKQLYWPTSYFIYKLAGNKIKGAEWIAALGTIADFGFENCKDLIKKYTKAKSKENLTRTKMWKISNMLFSLIALKGPSYAFKTLYSSKTIRQFLSKKEVVSIHQKFQKIVEKSFKQALLAKEVYGNAVFAKIDQKVRAVRSIIAFMLAEKTKKVAFVYSKTDSKLVISIRGKGYDLRKIAKEASKGIGSGGGHPYASGALIKKEFFEEFKKRVIKILKN